MFRFKRHLKKIYLWILTICMIFSTITPMTIQAGQENQETWNGTGNGNFNGEGNLNIQGPSYMFEANSGFRCYLVNQAGLPVSNTVDFVRYRPWDVEAMNVEIIGAKDIVAKYFDKMGLWSNAHASEGYKEILYIGGVKTDRYRLSTNINDKIYIDGRVPEGNGVFNIKRKDTNKAELVAGEYEIVTGKMYTITSLEMALAKSMMASGYKFPFITTKAKTVSSYVHPDPKFNGAVLPISTRIPASVDSFQNIGVELTGAYLKYVNVSS